MSSLFGRVEPVPVQINFSETSDSNDGVSVGRELWNILLALNFVNSSDDGPVEKLAISLAPRCTRPRQPRSRLPSVASLTCWARLHSEIDNGISIPRSWEADFPQIFPIQSAYGSKPSSLPSHTHSIVPIRLVILAEIILVALSPSAYELARIQSTVLENWFTKDEPIIRQGLVYSHKASASPEGETSNGSSHHNGGAESPVFQYKYEVAMCDSVLQGIGRIGTTRFHVVRGKYDDDSESIVDETFTETATQEQADGIDEDGFEDVFDHFEVDEGFLASSVFRHTLRGPINDYNENWCDDVSLVDDSETPSISTATTQEDASAYHLIQPYALSFPVFDEQSHCSECQVIVRPADLGRNGIFSGDWGFVSQKDETNSRLARIFADEGILAGVTAPTLAASPVFLHNLTSSTMLDTSVETVPPEVIIRPSPFGSRSPPVPTAKAVTVARVASPIANDRTYQPLFLRALKLYFERSGACLLKKGDIIAVGINVMDTRLIMERGDAKNDNSNGQSEQTLDILDYDLPLSFKSPTHTVFFKVTNLEYAVLDTIVNGDVSPSDSYASVTMGEYGCWVDPKITKIVQTGLEQTRVPDVAEYMGLRDDFTLLPKGPSVLVDAPSAPYRKLLDLIAASLFPSAVDYDLQLSILLKGARGVGKQTVSRWVAQKLGMHIMEVNCFDTVGDTDAKTEGALRARFEKAATCSPCIFHLRCLDAIAQKTQALETGREPHMVNVLRECMADLRKAWKLTGFPVVVIGSTSDSEKVPLGVLGCFKHEVFIEPPSEAERFDILQNLLPGVLIAPDVLLEHLARQTAALVPADLVDLIAGARLASIERAISQSSGTGVTESDLMAAGIALTGGDFELALSKARTSYSESIGAPKIPNVGWDDVGGLAQVKSDILDTIQLPLEHPELFADGLKKRSGILLYGPPGTGKTLLAKAVATSCSLNFFSVKGPELLNMYIGESEANVRRVFQRARDAKPCVIFFDELDSVAPKRGNHGDSGGVMDRIVSQLLAELDGMAEGKGAADVFVIGATNRPDLLDSALLRPGRFDRMLYLGVSDTHEAQLKIMEALTRKFRLDPDLRLEDIAQQCPFNYTGADFYALCSDAMLKAMSRKAEEIETKIAELNKLPPPYEHPHPLTAQYYLAELATPVETDIMVSRSDFEQALAELVPSVSASEMEHYAAVQKRFAHETINAQKDGDHVGEILIKAPFGESVMVEPLIPRLDKGKGKGKGKEKAID